VPRPEARWLDLVADGTHRLVRIGLGPLNLQDVQPAAATEADPADPPGECMLAEAAERILASAAGHSFLHVVATGLRPLPAHRWDTGFSWWVRDDAGGWHVAVETDPQARSPGMAGEVGATALRLRLAPPLRTRPEEIEVTVTGRRTRTRAVVPVGPVGK
jgi:hypothetical protein